MSQKILISIVAIVAIIFIGGAIYFYQNRPANNVSNILPGGEGAGGSGLETNPPGEKACGGENTPGKAVFGKTLKISADKKTILLNDKPVVSIVDLPSMPEISIEENSRFTSAVLSPTESLIAFTVSSGWGGIKNVFSGLIYPVTFQMEGSVENPLWSYDGRYVVFSKLTPKPSIILALIEATALKPSLSENERVLDFIKIESLPAGIFSNLKDPYWGDNKDNKLYLLATSEDEKVNIKHAELWSVDASTSKWDFVCSAY